MRPPHFILLCLLTAVMYLWSPYNEFQNLASSPSSIFLTGRRSLRGLKMPLPDHKNRYLKSEVIASISFWFLGKFISGWKLVCRCTSYYVNKIIFTTYPCRWRLMRLCNQRRKIPWRSDIQGAIAMAIWRTLLTTLTTMESQLIQPQPPNILSHNLMPLLCQINR